MSKKLDRLPANWTHTRKTAGFGLEKMRDGGKSMTISANGVYAHVWFDGGVAQDDFGHNVRDSGEWQVIFSTSPDPLNQKPRGRELGRQEFRYADPKMRSGAQRMAEDYIKRQFYALKRNAAMGTPTGDLKHDLAKLANDVPSMRKHLLPLLREACGCGGDEMLSRFEEGKPADPTKNMSEAEKAKWEKYHGKVQELKSAGSLRGSLTKLAHDVPEMRKHLVPLLRQAAEDEEMLARFEEGKSADPTKNMSPADAKKWKEENKKNRDNFKKKGFSLFGKVSS